MSRRGNSTGRPMAAVLQMQVHRDESQVMELKKAKYLPYLFNLVMPKSFYQSSNRMVVARLYLDVHKHDKQAAAHFEGLPMPCFEVPTALFPHGAPMDKIVFMPTVMLPMGFEAGGVFGPGVIPRSSYPIDLIPSDHKGETPPLFVGLRSLYVQLPSEIENFLDKVAEFPATQDALMYGNYLSRQLVQMENPLELMLRPDFSLSMIYNIPAPPSPPSPYPYRQVSVQYNIYTPDLSNALMLMPHKSNLTVSILSTVSHPHVPSVALTTMGDEECPKFELPSDVFPICEGVNRPIFLPKRFLPKGFEAGCVFKPGSLSELWFVNYIGRFGTLQRQHTCAITPPLFVGKFCRGAVAENILKEMQQECKKKNSNVAGDVEPKAVEPKAVEPKAVEPKTAHVPLTKGGLFVMKTEHQTPPEGAHCVESYQQARERGCVVKLKKDYVAESTETQENDKVDSKSEDGKYLCYFKVDSDIELVAEATAAMGSAEISLAIDDKYRTCGVDATSALSQLHKVLDSRDQIRSDTDLLIENHIFRMERDSMLALRQPMNQPMNQPMRQPMRRCTGCGTLHK